jgi:predicted GNAT family acetyltransferase
MGSSGARNFPPPLDENMNVQAIDRASEFAEATRSFLLEREAENNLLFGLLERINDGEALYRVVRDGDRIIAAALQTDPLHNFILSHASEEAVVALADALSAEGRSLPGVLGSAPCVNRFSERWAELRGLTVRRVLEMGVYRLTKVIPPARSPRGQYCIAGPEDLDIVAKFIGEFVRVIGEPDTGAHVEGARRRIEAGTAALWKVDGQAVSIAASAGQTPNGIRVNLVYTPPQFRNHGYASATVATLSQRLLDSGRKFCFLFTDMANPTSNKIYRDIGYELVAEQKQFHFELPK